MAIPRKGSRLIRVDGVMYRWLVRHKPTYAQGLESAMTFAVEASDARGQVLIVTTGWWRPDNWLNAPCRTVSPRVVERAVRSALAAGWRPGEGGGRFAYRFLD